jgi:hypothetical protein
LRWYCGVYEDQDGGDPERNSSNWASFQSLEERTTGSPGLGFRKPENRTSLRWIDIVKQYTTREMSEPSDKLIAISAVAQRFVSMTEGSWGRYYAGIWTERFFEQLLWSTSESNIAKRLVQYRAPSWSWAAVDGRLDWPLIEVLMDAEILCTLLDVEIQPLRSKQPYGAVTSGRIKVYGQVKQVLWSADRKTVKDIETQAVVPDGIMQTFPDVLEHNAQDMTVGVLKVVMRKSWAEPRIFVNHVGDRFVEHVEVIPVKHFEGILLEHIGNEVYQRVGVMGVRSIKEDKISFPGWLKQWSLESRQWWSEGFISKEIYIV